MSGVKLTPEDIILSRWDSQGRLSKIISVGLIFVYLLGLLYGFTIPVSLETCRLFLLWPGIIVFVVVSLWLAAVTASIICALFSRKWTLRDDAFCVLLPTLITAFFSVLFSSSSIHTLFSEAKEEETKMNEKGDENNGDD